MNLTNLLVAAAVAVAAPLVAAAIPRIVVPVAVLEVLLGIVVGPQVLHLLAVDRLVSGFSQFGVAFLFFMAGLEVDLGRIKGPPLRAAGFGWLIGMAGALLVGFGAAAAGLHTAPLYLALALSTTALGALLPVLQDAGHMDSALGRVTMACGAVGEFVPIVVIALALNTTHRRLTTVLLLNVFVLVVLAAIVLVRRWQPALVIRVTRATMASSGQLAVRMSLLLLLALVALANAFGLDVLLGAFAAGMIVSQVVGAHDVPDEHLERLIGRYQGIGFGFAIPIFFVATGARFDLHALFAGIGPPLLMLLFVGLFLVLRGLPSTILVRRAGLDVPAVPVTLLCATALPLVVTITDDGVATHHMPVPVASALVGAAVLSVLVFPASALALMERRR
ncbi:cation:proton antiporter [Actinocatenispora rupis]|uniref:Sodium/hydrogen exchanger n=1 Tax=Actinocatenispora rupis TaxID=519421 RepID=A0A8J3NF98_9ACTN|nr:cation:proton antiporter [Actinocatenispora rupis]GID13514.1 sodium/hydrogen exchanger [Actinocatenispora rupis]